MLNKEYPIVYDFLILSKEQSKQERNLRYVVCKLQIWIIIIKINIIVTKFNMSNLIYENLALNIYFVYLYYDTLLNI